MTDRTAMEQALAALEYALPAFNPEDRTKHDAAIAALRARLVDKSTEMQGASVDKPSDLQCAAKQQEGERTTFEAWLRTKEWFKPHHLYRRDMKGSTRFGQYVCTDVESAWLAWQARAALASQGTPEQEPFAWATHHDEPMLFPTRKEAAEYCEDDEEPIALYRASHGTLVEPQQPGDVHSVAGASSGASTVPAPFLKPLMDMVDTYARVSRDGLSPLAATTARKHIEDEVGKLVQASRETPAERSPGSRRPEGDWGDSEPGGCECEECGCIFIGAEYRSRCKVCAAPPPAESASPVDAQALHAAIMNLPWELGREDFKRAQHPFTANHWYGLGHRDARHAAAELVAGTPQSDTERDAARLDWKLGDEFLPFHPDASHIAPEYRDGWNACYRASRVTLDDALKALGTARWALTAPLDGWTGEVLNDGLARVNEAIARIDAAMGNQSAGKEKGE